MGRKGDGDADQVDVRIAEQIGHLTVRLVDAERASGRVGRLLGPARDRRELKAGECLNGRDMGFPRPASRRVGTDQPDP